MDDFVCTQCKAHFYTRKTACPFCGGRVYPILDRLYA